MPAPNFSSVLRAAVAGRLAEVHVSMPGEIVSYNPATGEASVQPLLQVVRDTEGGTELVTLPIIDSVPVCFTGAGSRSMTFPINPGDTVMLLFSEASLDQWLYGTRSGPLDPGDPRRFHLNDAVALLGVRRFADVVPTVPGATVINEPAALLLGGPTAVHGVPRGDVLVSALNTLAVAINTYAVGIKPVADVSNAFTGVLTTAITAFTAQLAGVVSPKVRVE